jgi:DNA-binding NtrC family response regulator
MPPLRERKEDIILLFRKFTTDFAEKYKVPVLQLTPDAEQALTGYSWPGNIRQLKNITEQISVLEESRTISADTVMRYLPPDTFSSKPVLVPKAGGASDFTEREILYKVLFDMKNDLHDLKKLVLGMIESGGRLEVTGENEALFERVFAADDLPAPGSHSPAYSGLIQLPQNGSVRSVQSAHSAHEVVEESLSLMDSEKELIRRALQKHKNKRKYAAEELGISERTLYRKIKEYKL